MSDEHFDSLGVRLGALNLLRVLGTGASATVYHSRSESGEQYAIKVIRVENSGVRCRKGVLKEIKLHSLVSSHPNIIPLLDVLLDDSTVENAVWSTSTFLIMPYASSGDLHSLILKHKLYLNRPVLLRSVFLQILRGVQHCHNMGVFHRDIKSENILTFENGTSVMLADFGLATTDIKSQEWMVGTSSHMSPECIGGSYRPRVGYSPAANDVWSLGILLVNLLTACHPWRRATTTDESFIRYCRGPAEFLARALPISSQANAILRRVFVAEEHRPNVTTFITKVCATEEWYDTDAVFEGGLARWREPEDCVGSDGWIRCQPIRHQGPEPLSTHLHDGAVNKREHNRDMLDGSDSSIVDFDFNSLQ